MNCSAASAVLLAASLLCVLSSAHNQSTPAPTTHATRAPVDPEAILRQLDHDDIREPALANDIIFAATQAPPSEAIPVLEHFYTRHKNDPPVDGVATLRDATASALVRLGDPNPMYWNVLVSEADEALSSPVPFPGNWNAKSMDDIYTPQQKAWGAAHHMSVWQMQKEAMMVLPIKLAFLIPSKDPRAIPILRTALKSENMQIQSSAAKGLAQLGDKDSIPTIITICRAHPEYAHFIAWSLVDFNDPTADKVFKEYFPTTDPEQLRESHRAHSILPGSLTLPNGSLP